MRSLIEKYWPRVLAIAGVMNVIAFWPQIYDILTTHKVGGISIPMFVMFLFIQVAFGIQGWLTKSKEQMVSMLVSAVESTLIIALVWYLR